MHWSIGRPLRRIDRWRLERAGFDSVYSVASDARGPVDEELDLLTVAFNNSHVISEQIRLLRASLVDRYAYTVLDNSSEPAHRREIESVCRREAVPYIRLPRTRSSSYDPSSSHGRALNWAWANYIRPRSARYFGFLDHDVFPRRPTSLLRHLQDQPVWGHLQTRGERWYLWPGLCVFDARWLAGRLLDFMPGPGFDVGGRLYELLAPSLRREELEWPSLAYGQLREGGVIPQEHLYELFDDDWLHTINGSGWMPVEGRDRSIAALLERL